MANFLIVVTLGSVLVAVVTLQGACAGEDKQATAKPTDCVGQLNDPRKKAGFMPFTQATEKSSLRDQSSIRFDEVCDILAFEPENFVDLLDSKKVTPAVSFQNGEHADCEAAVKQWEKGVTRFPSLPPPFEKSPGKKKEPYAHSDAISFVALFNPNPNPTVYCMYFECPAIPADENGPAHEAFKALVCLTSPPALEDGKAPFTQEQWDKIKAAAPQPDSPSGTTAAAPTFVVLLAVALGVSLF